MKMLTDIKTIDKNLSDTITNKEIIEEVSIDSEIIEANNTGFINGLIILIYHMSLNF